MNSNKILVGGAFLTAFYWNAVSPASAQSFPTPAPGETVKVACVGDSITAGTGASSGSHNYPSLLGDLLGPGYTVANFGESGATALNDGDSPYKQRSSYAGSAAFAPNVVVVLLGANDSKPQNWAHKAEFAADYSSLLDYYAALPTHPKLYVCLPTPVPKSSYGINEPTIAEQIPIIRQVAAQKGATVIDVHGRVPDDNADFVDGVHPNDSGYVLLASAVYQGLTHAPVILPINDHTFYSSQTVTLTAPSPEAAIRYTTTGAAPTRSSALYTGPLTLRHTATLKAQAFGGKSPLGSVSAATFTALALLPAQAATAPAEAGLSYTYYEGAFQNMSDFAGQTPVSTGTVPDFSLTPRKRDTNFGIKYDGCITVPVTGAYTFGTVADDGTALVIDGQTVIGSNGPHGSTPVFGKVALAAGRHPFTLFYFQDSGDFSLQVTWQGPGIPAQAIPVSALSH